MLSLIPEDMESIRRSLNRWYAAGRRDLPWRRTADPYAIWVSEVMLQQTQVQTVIPYYERFLGCFPTLASLAQADLGDVLKIWEGLGYYARARNLHRAAQDVVIHHGGIIPGDAKAFRKLPGVGEYIAAAVGSIAYGEPLAVVDGNVKRVLARLFQIDAPVNDSGSQKVFREAAQALLDRKSAGDFNQAMMELGATVCTPKNPACEPCQISEWCRSYRDGTVSEYPRRNPSKTTPEVRIAVAVIFKDKRMLITRRKPEGLLGGLWEFPGGKISEGESAEAACLREIAEETGLEVAIRSHLTQVKHAYTHFRILMEVFLCDYVAGEVILNGPTDFRWVRIDELGDYPFPKANHKFMGLLKERLSG